jgi:hypothetical protein
MTFTEEQITNHIDRSTSVKKSYYLAVRSKSQTGKIYEEEFSWLLDMVQITDLNYIDTILDQHKSVIKKYINYILDRGKNSDWRITKRFMCGLVLIAKFPAAFTVEKLVEKQWERDSSEIIVDAANKFKLCFDLTRSKKPYRNKRKKSGTMKPNKYTEQ